MAVRKKVDILKLFLSFFFLHARVQVLGLFWCPRDIYIYMYVCPYLEDVSPFTHVVLEEYTP